MLKNVFTVSVDVNGSHSISNSHGHRRSRSSFDSKAISPGYNNTPDMVADVEGNKSEVRSNLFIIVFILKFEYLALVVKKCLRNKS